MITVYLSLGSNLGNKIEYIHNAIDLIKQIECTELVKSSLFFETDPVGYLDQPKFINVVIEILTCKSPISLFESLQEIERVVGRVKRKKWHEREIDIDILFYGKIIIRNEMLKIPHPELYNRRFVLVPLNEIAPDFICPIKNLSIKELFSDCKDSSKIEIVNE